MKLATWVLHHWQIINIFFLTWFQPFVDKLKSMKKEVKKLQFRVRELKDRPEALEALESLLNHSSFFLGSIKNLTSTLDVEESIFTPVEVETLEKIINSTMVSADWI